MIIRELDNGLQLVQTDYETKEIDNYLGQEYITEHRYFVSINNGEYDAIYLYEGTIPDLDKEVYKLWDNRKAVK